MEPVNDNPKQTIAYCRACGKALSPEQVQNYQGTVYCVEHMPQVTPPPQAAAPGDGGPNPYYQPPAPPQSSVSPGWAFVLGLIPGVGAIYNGQYAKGFIHALVTGVLFSLAGHGAGSTEPLVEFLIPVWILYMAFEAYHTAKKRQMGLQVDEFSSVLPLRHGNLAGPAALIGIGVLFLLNNLDLLRISQLLRYWPVVLIGLGLYMLYVRLTGSPSVPAQPEVSHEHNQ